MATLAVTSISRSGIDLTLAAAAAGGDEFPNDGQTFVVIHNAHGSAARTITFVTPQTIDGLAVADRTVTVNAGVRKLVGPFQTGAYNNANDRVGMTYSDSGADINVAAFKLTPV